jgi:uncharacterized protein YndB with AHSA1/START domain
VSVTVAAAIPDDGRTLVITRTFAAPREDVFAAWVDPEQMARWMGPRNIASQVDRMDVRPGGAYRITMRDVDTGATYVVGGIYREIVWPERLVFTWAWERRDRAQARRGDRGQRRAAYGRRPDRAYPAAHGIPAPRDARQSRPRLDGTGSTS